MTTAEQIRSMTYQQLRDWWAEDHGYKYVEGREHVTVPHWIDSTGEPVWNAECRLAIHPLEDTLEAVAACLGEGWSWTRGKTFDDGPVWCSFLKVSRGVRRVGPMVPDTGDEKTDRLRLACLARLAERGAKC